MSLRLQAVKDAATDQNFRYIAQHLEDIPNVLELSEQVAPEAPPAGRVRIYAKDNAGKTQLVALFSTGAEQPLATEP